MHLKFFNAILNSGIMKFSSNNCRFLEGNPKFDQNNFGQTDYLRVGVDGVRSVEKVKPYLT